MLLILAGVALASLSGENGLFIRAKRAAQIHNVEAAEEALKLELDSILAEKEGETNLNYLEGMKIDNYDVKVSGIGRIVTMTQGNETYAFFVDSQYNVTPLTDINITVNNGNNNGRSISRLYRKSIV